MRFINRGELEDEKIVTALKSAVRMYEDGELLEVEGLLIDIVESIKQFDREYD